METTIIQQLYLQQLYSQQLYSQQFIHNNCIHNNCIHNNCIYHSCIYGNDQQQACTVSISIKNKELYVKTKSLAINQGDGNEHYTMQPCIW